ncbi:Glycerol-3-phosphate regulon repressor [Hyphomicrobiales bacterium]|nr:Glycerol-3-phosphate regulon repressor [Hyphomicrobiales bacterium]CAH1694913.1 Glycerol-3-phosphate regulon repressor [Hyphomicrobiales bacterium]
MTATFPISDAHLPARRRADITNYVRLNGEASVAELASHFQVSIDTVRRDLDQLARTGLVARTHGGAVPVSLNQVTPLSVRLGSNREAKERIAHAAAALISDGETLIANGGSTTLAFATALEGRRDLTLVTNNLSIPHVMPPGICSSLYVIGGDYRADTDVTVGPVVLNGSAKVTVDTAVIGVHGISADLGFSSRVLEEATMIAAMMQAARRTVIVADSSKFGRRSFAMIAPIAEAAILVTDAALPDELAGLFRDSGVRIVVA